MLSRPRLSSCKREFHLLKLVLLAEMICQGGRNSTRKSERKVIYPGLHSTDQTLPTEHLFRARCKNRAMSVCFMIR
jgi:hypothetical protein